MDPPGFLKLPAALEGPASRMSSTRTHVDALYTAHLRVMEPVPVSPGASRVTSHGEEGPGARHTIERRSREDQDAQVVKLGVLIVGSLYWDVEPPRPRWRAERLDCAHQEHVRVPIRYGRRSTTRGDSYTMVVSPALAADKLGTAIAVPYQSCDLVEEAEELWAAEDNSNIAPEGSISASFGCVALLENPDLPLPDELRKAWMDRVGREEDYKTPIRMDGEDRDVVDQCSGFLKIEWPRTVTGPPLGWNALLVTATSPRGPKQSSYFYPSPREIADAWSIPENHDSRPGRTVDYFWNNQKNRITTYQDPEIEARLRHLGLTR